MCKFHQWEPIYIEKDYGEKIRKLFGICMNCKKVMSAESLMKRLNVYEKKYKEVKMLEDE